MGRSYEPQSIPSHRPLPGAAFFSIGHAQGEANCRFDLPDFLGPKEGDALIEMSFGDGDDGVEIGDTPFGESFVGAQRNLYRDTTDPSGYGSHCHLGTDSVGFVTRQ